MAVAHISQFSGLLTLDLIKKTLSFFPVFLSTILLSLFLSACSSDKDYEYYDENDEEYYSDDDGEWEEYDEATGKWKTVRGNSYSDSEEEGSGNILIDMIKTPINKANKNAEDLRKKDEEKIRIIEDLGD